MPFAATRPGAWPAHVLIATTRGRLSFPEPARAAPDTPAAPLPRSGSGGALLSALKSSDETPPPAFVAAVPAAPLSAPAHLRMSRLL